MASPGSPQLLRSPSREMDARALRMQLESAAVAFSESEQRNKQVHREIQAAMSAGPVSPATWYKIRDAGRVKLEGLASAPDPKPPRVLSGPALIQYLEQSVHARQKQCQANTIETKMLVSVLQHALPPPQPPDPPPECEPSPRSPRRHRRASSLELNPLELMTESPRHSNHEKNTGIAIKYRAERQNWDEERTRLAGELQKGAEELHAMQEQLKEFRELSIMLQDQVSQAENQRAAMHGTMRSLLNFSSNLVIATDRHGRIKEMNRVAADYCGCELDVEGAKLVDVLGIQGDASLVKRLSSAVKTASSGGAGGEISLVSGCGHALLLQISPWIGVGNVAVVGAAVIGCCIALDEVEVPDEVEHEQKATSTEQPKGWTPWDDDGDHEDD